MQGIKRAAAVRNRVRGAQSSWNSPETRGAQAGWNSPETRGAQSTWN